MQYAIYFIMWRVCGHIPFVVRGSGSRDIWVADMIGWTLGKHKEHSYHFTSQTKGQ